MENDIQDQQTRNITSAVSTSLNSSALSTFLNSNMYLQNIRSHDSNARDLSSFATKMTELEKILVGTVDFSWNSRFLKDGEFQEFWWSFYNSRHGIIFT